MVNTEIIDELIQDLENDKVLEQYYEFIGSTEPID